MRLHPQKSARRVAGVLLALMHLSAASLAAVDAVFHAHEPVAPLHVESEGANEGESHHDHLFCQTLRSVSTTTHSAIRPALETEHLRSFTVADDLEARLCASSASRGLHTPRGPPSI